MGRGRHYRRWKRWIEKAEARLYGEGWAARVAYRLGLQGRLHVDRRTIPLVHPRAAPPLRAAFLSDLHSGPLTDPRLLQKVTAEVSAFSPDVLLLGGDYASYHHRFLDRILAPLSEIRPPLGAFAVLGNHDLWLDDAAIVEALTRAGIQVLVNETRRLAPPFDAYAVVGLDDPAVGEPDLRAAAPPEGTIRLLLMHTPFGLPMLDGFDFDIAFMGHTHGGQVALPGGIPIVLPFGSGDPRFARGYFPPEGRRSHVLVSRGVGMSDVPVRLVASSEVHLWTIVPGIRDLAQ